MDPKTTAASAPDMTPTEDLDTETSGVERQKDRERLSGAQAFIILLIAIVSCAVLTGVLVSSH